MEWYLKVINSYFDFNGRARRKEYWMFVLINSIISIVSFYLDNILGTTFAIGYGPIYIGYGPGSSYTFYCSGNKETT